MISEATLILDFKGTKLLANYLASKARPQFMWLYFEKQNHTVTFDIVHKTFQMVLLV